MAAASAVFIPLAGPLVAAGFKAGNIAVGGINKPLKMNTCAMLIGTTLGTAYTMPFDPTYIEGDGKGKLFSVQDKFKNLKTNEERTITAYNNGKSQEVVTVSENQMAKVADSALTQARY